MPHEDVDSVGRTRSSIVPNIFDVLYREFCRARLAEMRKQLQLWPSLFGFAEKNNEASYLDEVAHIGKGSECRPGAEKSPS